MPTAYVSAAESIALRQLIAYDFSFPATTPLEAVHKGFGGTAHDYAAVLDGRRVVCACSRSYIGQQLGLRYGFALFSKKPIREFMLPCFLQVGETTPMREVLQLALSRTGEAFDIDVVLTTATGEYLGLIPVCALVAVQSEIVADQLRFLQEQEDALVEKNQALQLSLRQLQESQERLSHSEEQLRHAQKMDAVGRLAGGVAHDFNNMLTVITGYCSLLSQHVNDQPKLRRHVEEIQRGAERAAGLTRQLLAFSRRQVLQTRVINLNEILQGMDGMLRRLIGEDVELRTRLTAHLKCIRADPGQIEQVIMNLAVNARDAMPVGGQLTLATGLIRPADNPALLTELSAPVDEYCFISVSDTGVGMTEQVKAHLFEPFFTTKGPGKGVGLGLATSYGIIKQSNGHICVTSNPGRGTTFWIYLPAVVERVTHVTPNVTHALPTGCTGTILVVEDESALRELAEEILTQAGYQVLLAGNGIEGLAIVNEGAPVDLIITDVIMPQMGGREMVEQIRCTHPDSKVIYISGYTADALSRGGELNPGTSFLEKPFTPARLLEKAHRAFQHPEPVAV
ncbi:MAG: ATP-binding protein [Verrucomicrobiota bacterium]